MDIVLDNGEILPDERESIWIEPIPEGEYTLAFIGYRPWSFNGAPKLEVYFRITDTDYAGRVVARYWNIESISDADGKPKWKRKWKAKRSGGQVTDLVRLFGKRAKSFRPDRIRVRKLFSPQNVIGIVAMSEVNTQKEEVPVGAQSPIVRKLLRIEETEEEGNSSHIPCSTLLSSPSPPPDGNPQEAVGLRDSADQLGSLNGPDLGILPQSDDLKLIDKLIGEEVAKTPEDIEKLTGGRISAKTAHDLHWFFHEAG